MAIAMLPLPLLTLAPPIVFLPSFSLCTTTHLFNLTLSLTLSLPLSLSLSHTLSHTLCLTLSLFFFSFLFSFKLNTHTQTYVCTHSNTLVRTYAHTHTHIYTLRIRFGSAGNIYKISASEIFQMSLCLNRRLHT